MKYILPLFLLVTVTNAYSWDCRGIESTMTLVKSQGCNQIRLCLGYAECRFSDGKTSIGRIICKTDAQFNCPSANDCMEQAVRDRGITIGLQAEADPRGLFRFCPSRNQFSTTRARATDAVNSRFCDTASGVYLNKVEATVSGMTGVNGGGSQMGHTR